MKKYGCVGEKLTHSFSKEIHAALADYEYELIELKRNEVEPFFKKRDFTAVNVTIPYKQTVIPLLDEISDVAKRIGAVNTVVNKDGKLYGYNTDYFGLKALIEKVGADLKNKKVLVLGTGGTSKTACALATDLGAKNVLSVSRNAGENITYQEAVTTHRDANIIINTTPVGMYPSLDGKPIDISPFKNLEAVIDVVYNPLNTRLVLDAKARGIKAEGGLYMLLMQAVFAVEKFLGKEIPKDTCEKLFASILGNKQNIILTGMPGSGKSTVGKLLNIHGFEFFDSDKEIENRCGKSVSELIKEKGEGYFRDLESAVIKELSSKSGRIIATGGGAVLREENITSLKQNGKIFFLDANLSRLIPTDDRPLSNTKEKLEKIYNDRIDIYKNTADVVVPDMDTPNKAAEYILLKRTELI